MTDTGNCRRMFGGANTSKGFVSLFDNMINPFNSRKIIIKGGPGLGKSTFMRQIGDFMMEKGYDVEYFHCSSDPGSLDGVVIPSIKVAILDGTSPHTVDPVYPGAVDEILNFGEFWNESALRQSREEIIKLTCETGRHFSRAYRLLKAAEEIKQDWREANIQALDVAQANKVYETLKNDIFKSSDIASAPGKQRHLFASAITPEGFVHYLPTFVGPCSKRYVVEGGPGSGKSTLVSRLAASAVKRGIDVEIYHCSLNPDSIEHLIIPSMGVAIVTSHEPHEYMTTEDDTLVDMSQCLDETVTRRYSEIMEYDRRMMKRLLDRSVSTLRSAIVTHDALEDIYTPNIDFSGITKLCDKTVEKIFRYAEDKM